MKNLEPSAPKLLFVVITIMMTFVNLGQSKKISAKKHFHNSSHSNTSLSLQEDSKKTHESSKVELLDFEKAELALANDFIEKAGYGSFVKVIPDVKPGSYQSPWQGKWDKNTLFFKYEGQDYFANGEFMIKISENVSKNAKDNMVDLDKVVLLLVIIFYCFYEKN